MAEVILRSNRRKDPSRKPFVFCLAERIELGSRYRIFYLLSILPRLLVELQGALRRRGCSLIPLPWTNYTEIN